MTRLAPVEKVTATLTAAAAGNYAAGDVVSNSATDTEGDPLTFSNIVRGDGREFLIVGARAICSEDSVVWRLRLHFFDAVPAAADVEMDDNAAFAITTSTNYLGYIDLPAMEDEGGVAVAQNNDLRAPFKCASGDQDIYMVVETLDAETNETASMTLRFDLYVE